MSPFYVFLFLFVIKKNLIPFHREFFFLIDAQYAF